MTSSDGFSPFELRLSKRAALLILTSLGGALAVLIIYDTRRDWLFQGKPLWVTVAESALPFLLALSVPLAGWWLARRERDAAYLSAAAKWALLGSVAMLEIAGLVLGFHFVQERFKPHVFVAQMAAVGALVGLFAGYLRAHKQAGRPQAERKWRAPGGMRLGRRTSLAILVGIGAGLLGVIFFDIYQDWIPEGNPLWTTIAENALPVLLALAVSILGWRLAQVEQESIYLSEMAKWALGGGLGISVIVGLVVGFQLVQGKLKPGILLAQLATVGAVAGLFVGYRIAQVRQMRGKLRRRAARLQGLTNSIPGVVYRFYVRPGGERGLHLVSEQAEELLGLSPQAEGFYERFIERVPAAHREAFVGSVEEAARQEAPWRQEVPFVRPDGRRIWLLATSVPEKQEGELVFDGVLLDITEQKRAERALREERDRLETLFESLPTPVVRCTVEEGNTLIAEINQAFEEVFGVEASAAKGEDINELLAGAETRKEAATIDRRALEESPVETEVRRETSEGERVFQLQAAGRTREEGPPEVYAIYTDITARKRHERKLEEAKEEAEEAAELKTAMMANMSHEIRTPLTTIIGFAEVLKGQLEGRAEDLIERIRQGGQRLMRTLDSILQLSRLEAGAYSLKREKVDLSLLVEETAELLSPRAEEEAVSLEPETPSGPVKGYWNEGALNRITENLLENAIKFTPEGGRVEVRAWTEDGEAVLEVEDTGVGISEEALPEIFEAFRQESEGLSREYEGTGLGLSIVRRLAEELRGTIEVESNKGEGTRVTVRLPKARAEDA